MTGSEPRLTAPPAREVGPGARWEVHARDDRAVHGGLRHAREGARAVDAARDRRGAGGRRGARAVGRVRPARPRVDRHAQRRDDDRLLAGRRARRALLPGDDRHHGDGGGRAPAARPRRRVGGGHAGQLDRAGGGVRDLARRPGRALLRRAEAGRPFEGLAAVPGRPDQTGRAARTGSSSTTRRARSSASTAT